MPIVVKISSGSTRPRFLRVCHTGHEGSIWLGEDARGRIVSQNPARPYLYLCNDGARLRIRPALSGFKVNGNPLEGEMVLTAADSVSFDDLRFQAVITRTLQKEPIEPPFS